MRWLFIARLAVVNLLSKRLRTSLTIGGIAIGVSVIVFLLGLGAGLQHIITTEIAQSGSQEVVSVSSKRTRQLKLDANAISRLSSISGVSSVEQLVGLSGRVTYHGISLDLPVYAVSADYLDSTPQELVAGRSFVAQSLESQEILISTRALQALGVSSSNEAIGKKVTFDVAISQDWATNQEEAVRELSWPDFEIVGVVEKGGAPVVYTPLEPMQELGVNAATEVKLLVSVPDRISAVRETVEQLGFQTSSIRDTIEQVNQIFGVIQAILVIFGGITLIIAVFGTLNTITIALIEQTRQVGFLRILGIRRQDVRRLFMLQSILLSTTGAVIGVIAGGLLGLVSNSVVWYIAEQNGLTHWSVYQLPVGPIFVIVSCSVGLGWVLGIGPARRAVNLRPLEAMRV